MRTCIVSSQDSVTQVIKLVLLEGGTEWAPLEITTLERGADVVPVFRPDVVIMVLPRNVEQGLATLLEVRSLSQAHLIAVGPSVDSRLILRILHEGANDYVNVDDLSIELKEALDRLQARKLTQGKPGKTIALLAPSGGSGSSTLAVNVATILAKEHQKCALVDLKLAAGDLAALLDLKPTHTLAELCLNAERMDRSMFERSLVRHSSGVHLLAPPSLLKDVSLVTPTGIRQVLNLARTMFPYVVVDIDHSFHEEQIQALRQANIILLVLRLDFTSLRNARKTMEYLAQLGIPQERLRLVVNRYGQPKEVPLAMAEEALGMKIFHCVPDEPKTVNRANNNGIPVVLDKPTAYVSKSVLQMTMSINGLHK